MGAAAELQNLFEFQRNLTDPVTEAPIPTP